MAKAIGSTLTMAALGFIAGQLLARALEEDERKPSLHPYLGLPVPRTWLVRAWETETEFESSASLDEVFGFVHDELTATGWQRTDVDRSDSEIEAHYARGGIALAVELEQDGENLFELELDLRL